MGFGCAFVGPLPPPAAACSQRGAASAWTPRRRSRVVLGFDLPSPSRAPASTEVRPAVTDAGEKQGAASPGAGAGPEPGQACLHAGLLDDVELLVDDVEGSVVVSNEDIALDHHRAQTRSVAVALLAVTAALGLVIGLASLQEAGVLGGAEDASGGGGGGALLLRALAPAGYSFKKSLLAGAGAGMSRGLSRILTFPLDTIKTRQQAVLTLAGHEAEDEKGTGTGTGKDADAKDEDDSSVNAEALAEKAKAVHKGRLFDGLLPMLLVAGPANAAFFVTYDYMVALATALGYPPKTHWAVELGAALLASLPANVIRIPAEVTKQRVQAGLEAKAWDAAVDIWKADGPLGLYVGGGAHLMRELPFNMVQFLAFRKLKEALVAASGGSAASVGAKAVLGALAAAVASLATQPLDTIKTGQMLDRGGRGSNESYEDGVKRIYRRFGLPGLFLGATPRLGLCAIGGAFYFLANEYVMALLSQPHS